jgi:transposase
LRLGKEIAMTRPYSEDLRNRVVAAFEAGETIRDVGARFGVSASCVSKWSRRKRETGSCAPAKIGGRKPRNLSGATAQWLRDRLSAAPFTLRGLVAELAARGVKAHLSGVWVFFREENLTFKKNFAGQRAGSP